MKNYFLLITAFIALLSGCKREEEKPQEFVISYHNNLFTLPQATQINVPGEYEIKKLYIDVAGQFNTMNQSPDQIIETKVSKLEVGLYSAHYPKTETIDFLKSVTVYMKADGLPEIEVGSANSIADGLYVTNLAFTGQDVREYLKKPTLQLRAKATTDKALAKDFYLEVNIGFRFLYNK